MNFLIILFSLLVVSANLFLFFCILFFAKNKQDKASKTGFLFMKVLCLINAFVIAGGTLYVI